MDLLNHLPELLQVLFLAVLQGVTELFPVSSLGQSIIIPGLSAGATCSPPRPSCPSSSCCTWEPQPRC